MVAIFENFNSNKILKMFFLWCVIFYIKLDFSEIIILWLHYKLNQMCNANYQKNLVWCKKLSFHCSDMVRGLSSMNLAPATINMLFTGLSEAAKAEVARAQKFWRKKLGFQCDQRYVIFLCCTNFLTTFFLFSTFLSTTSFLSRLITRALEFWYFRKFFFVKFL